MTATIVNKVGGELLDFPTDTPEQIVEAWRQAQEFEAMSKRLKEKLKPLIETYLPEDGTLHAGDYAFRKYTSQNMTYNKEALRRVFDPDLMDVFTVVNKKLVTDYIKENPLEQDQLTALEAGLEPSSRAFTAYRLEKIQ